MRSPELPPPEKNPLGYKRIELDQAVRTNTNAALILFLMRNPDGPEAAEARSLLDQRRTPDPAGAARGPDADIITAFDTARLQGDDAALQAFIQRYGATPLVPEAQRLMRAAP